MVSGITLLRKKEEVSNRAFIYAQVLINDILDISKIEAGKLELFPTEIHLLSFLKTLIGIIKTRVEGTGLELPISRRIVQLMGGDLHVESRTHPTGGLKPGHGSRFWFEVTLPTVSGMEVPEIPADNIKGYQGVRRRILVVDDKDYNRLVLVNMLEPLGFEVVTANDGKEGIDKTLSFKPDLIFMDLVMPVKTGFDTVKELRDIQLTKDTPIIAVSASILKESQQDSLNVGCRAFLSKPIELPRLLNFLKTYLHLEWIYSEKEEGVIGAMIAPPVDELKILYDMIHIGDIYGITERILHIETLGEEYIPFTRKLYGLAQNFDIGAILTLVEKYLDKE